jgi:hypothetical protein
VFGLGDLLAGHHSEDHLLGSQALWLRILTVSRSPDSPCRVLGWTRHVDLSDGLPRSVPDDNRDLVPALSPLLIGTAADMTPNCPQVPVETTG